MTMKHAIAFSLTLTGVLAIPPRASAQFDLDLQATEIGTQLQEILNRVTQYTAQLTQFTRLDCSAQGMATGAEATPINEAAVACDTLNMIGAFRDSYQQLLAAPTDLLNTPAPFLNWRDVLGAADTVTEADIRNVYPGSADRPVATFLRRRDYADRSVVLAHARADASIALTDALDAAQAAVADFEAQNSVTRTALAQTQVAAALTRARLLVALSNLRSHEAAAQAADAYNAEVARREADARGGRPMRGGWPIVPLLKRSGPRNRQSWPPRPTRESNPCTAAFRSRTAWAGTNDHPIHQGASPMKKTLIVLFAIVALIGSAGFETVTAQDGGVAAYLVMIANQGTQITNQLTALTRMTAHIDQLTGQFEHLKESALGQIGAITDPIADLVAVPTDLLHTTRDWHSDFTGPAGSLVTALTELSDGTSLSERWRDVLQEADTVTEGDIRNVYPGSADTAVAVFQRRRDYADRSIVLAHARADAAASLAATAVEIQDKIDTVAGQNNVSDTALQQAILAGNLSQGQLTTALAQMEAIEASAAAADAYNAEVARREAEARRLADRAALEAQWAEEQATIAAAADQRIQSMYGGFQIPDGLGGNSRP